MEQRINPRQGAPWADGRRAVRGSRRRGAFPTPLRGRRDDLSSIFNEGYSASGDNRRDSRARCARRAIRLARLLLRFVSKAKPEIMGLTSVCCCCSTPRSVARFDAEGRALLLLDDQDRSLWNAKMIAEGLALLEQRRCAHRRTGPYQVQAAIAALHVPRRKA